VFGNTQGTEVVCLNQRLFTNS